MEIPAIFQNKRALLVIGGGAALAVAAAAVAARRAAGEDAQVSHQIRPVAVPSGGGGFIGGAPSSTSGGGSGGQLAAPDPSAGLAAQIAAARELFGLEKEKSEYAFDLANRADEARFLSTRRDAEGAFADMVRLLDLENRDADTDQNRILVGEHNRAQLGISVLDQTLRINDGQAERDAARDLRYAHEYAALDYEDMRRRDDWQLNNDLRRHAAGLQMRNAEFDWLFSPPASAQVTGTAADAYRSGGALGLLRWYTQSGNGTRTRAEIMAAAEEMPANAAAARDSAAAAQQHSQELQRIARQERAAIRVIEASQPAPQSDCKPILGFGCGWGGFSQSVSGNISAGLALLNQGGTA